MPSNLSMTIEDYDGEISTVAVNLQDLAAGVDYSSLEADSSEIVAAVQGLIVGEMRAYGISTRYLESAAPVSDIQAARESKWLVTYRDTTELLLGVPALGNPGFNKLFSFEIPAADRTLLPANSDELDLTDATVAPIVAALEANIRSPYNRGAAGLTPTNEIVSIRFVGRAI